MTKTSVLIVEDEEMLRDAFKLVLTKEGFKVIVAENGKVGLEKLKKATPDIVLLDMLMPVVNGLEFLQQAQIKTDYPKTRVIVLSNLSDSITIDEKESFGVSQTLLKAELSPLDLVAKVRSYATT